MASDDDLFAREMAGVRRLQPKPVADVGAAAVKDAGLAARRAAATSAVVADDNTLSSDYAEPVGPHDILNFRREGVQHGVFRKFRLGRYQLEATLDLHRKTVEEARIEVFDFIRQCHRYDLRTVLIMHGKGERNPDRQAVLKSFVARWLAEISEVIAFHSARRSDGGTGAVYVMLKKSEVLKQKTREEHA